VSTVVSVVTPSGKGGKDVELPAEFFGAKVNIPLIHQVVVAQEAAARQGTHATKTRGAVRGGGKKPYRQKGTGRARQGSLRAPQYTGGGTVHGPVPRSYVQRTPKKMKAAALRGALSDRSSHGRVAVVSRFVEGEEPSTSSALTVLRAAVGETGARLSRSVLVVVNDGDELTRKSLRNAVHVRVLTTGQLNTYDVLASDYVVFTHAALSGFTGQEPPADDAPARAKPAAKGAAAKDRPAKVEAAKVEAAKDAPGKAEPAAKDEASKDEAAPRRTRTARGSGAAGGDKPDEEQQ
jgi:large subunit ribosomal protein L4